jgi:hypothetical protein
VDTGFISDEVPVMAFMLRNIIKGVLTILLAIESKKAQYSMKNSKNI